MKWSVLETETVLNSDWLTIKKQKLLTSKGYLIEEYYVGERKDVAMVAALFPDNRIALISEYKHGCGENVWQLPAGNIEHGDSPQETAERELSEEVGLSAQSYELIGSWFISPPWLLNRIYIFLAQGIEFLNSQKLEKTEEIEVKIIDLEDAIRMVASNEIKDAHSALTILFLSTFKFNKPFLEG